MRTLTVPSNFIWQSLSSMSLKRRLGKQKVGFMEVVLDQREGGQGLEQTFLNLTLGSMTVTRSHPALGEDSDSDGDIEVPRFQSLDCAEDSDGDLEVERDRQSVQIVS